ncbi:flagellar motor switch protein FliN [bacterium]|nr:MAG: flagellar motor switch protein FliN [bacterium]
MLQEFAVPAIVIQFSFAGKQNSTQSVLLPLDTASALYQAVSGTPGAMDETTLEELRPTLEAIVQGICLGVGNTRDEVIIAGDLSVRLGRFSRPSNLQPTDTMIRFQLALGVGSTIGSLTWVMDPETAHYIADLPVTSEATPSSFGVLPPFGASRDDEESHGLDILMDIPLDISVELGRTRLVVRDVVDLGVGSIVEIDKAAGEPVDIIVNGRLVARGEVVVIEDNFGVRITEILNPRERLARIGEAA